MFKDLELGGATIKALTVNGQEIAGTRVGDGGAVGTADTAFYTGNRADYFRLSVIFFNTANQGTITAYLVVDDRQSGKVDANGDPILTDSKDILVGIGVSPVCQMIRSGRTASSISGRMVFSPLWRLREALVA